MSQQVIEAAKRALNFTASTNVNGRGIILGVLVASSSSGTIKITDGLSGTIVNTMSVSAGSFYPIPVEYSDLVITVTGTLDATLFLS